jgi:hypothetical protein
MFSPAQERVRDSKSVSPARACIDDEAALKGALRLHSDERLIRIGLAAWHRWSWDVLERAANSLGSPAVQIQMPKPGETPVLMMTAKTPKRRTNIGIAYDATRRRKSSRSSLDAPSGALDSRPVVPNNHEELPQRRPIAPFLLHRGDHASRLRSAHTRLSPPSPSALPRRQGGLMALASLP